MTVYFQCFGIRYNRNKLKIINNCDKILRDIFSRER